MPPRTNTIVPDVTAVIGGLEKQRLESTTRLQEGWKQTQEWLDQALQKYKRHLSNSVAAEKRINEPVSKKQKTTTALSKEMVEDLLKLKVVDLRKELKIRGLDVSGRKQELQERLMQALENEHEQKPEDDYMDVDREEAQDPVESEPKQQYELSQPVPMKTAPIQSIQSTQHVHQTNLPPVSNESNESHVNDKYESIQDVDNRNSCQDNDENQQKMMQPQVDIPNKKESTSAQNAVSPMVVKIEPPADKKSTNQSAERSAHSPNPINHSKPSTSLSKSPLAPIAPIAKASHQSPSPKRSPLKRVQSGVKAMVEKFSAQKSPPKVSLEDKVIPVKAAIKPKYLHLEESTPSGMGPPAPVGSSSLSTGPSSMSGALATPASGGGNISNSSSLSENMKARKEARLKKNAEVRNKYLEQTKSSASKTLSGGLTTSVSSLTAKIRNDQIRHKFAMTQSSSTTSMLNQAVSVPASTPLNKPLPVREEVLSPHDTYDMSDHEDSDSDCSQQREKKRIPEWARKEQLLAALNRQFCERDIDPDAIFGEVDSCNLEAIFGRKKDRYQRRTSSGNWAHDKVTAQEKLVYKRKMGYAQS